MDNYINVVIPFNYEKLINPYDKGDSLNSNNYNSTESQILSQLKDNPYLTIVQLTNITDFSESYIRKILASLKKKGTLSRIGGRKEGFWKVN